MARNMNMPRGGNGNIPGASSRWSNPPIRTGSKAKTATLVYDQFSNGYITPVPAKAEAKTPKSRAAKEIRIEAEEGVDDRPQEVHPYVMSHRVGVTDRITNMDPMGEEFIRSLNLKSTGQTMGAWITPLLVKFFGPTTEQPRSKALSELVPGLQYYSVSDIGSAGRPWNDSGWIVPRFQIGTGIVMGGLGGQTPGENYRQANFLLDLWKFRPVEMEVLAKKADLQGGAVKGKMTLVNHFEPAEGLECYSFIVSYETTRGIEEGLYNVWLNEEYITSGQRSMPMYFEMGGAANYIANATLACFGFAVDPKGKVSLEVQFKDHNVSTRINRDQLMELHALGMLNCDSSILLTHNQSAIGYDVTDHYASMMEQGCNANWHHLGMALNGNSTWQMTSDIRHLPWQVQPLMQRFFQRIGRTNYKATRSPFENSRKAGEFGIMSVADRTKRASKLLSKAFWNKIEETQSSLDTIIYDIRQQYITEELIAEQKRLWPDITGKELAEILTDSSDIVGRFVFELNDPKLQAEPSPVAQLEAATGTLIKIMEEREQAKATAE